MTSLKPILLLSLIAIALAQTGKKQTNSVLGKKAALGKASGSSAVLQNFLTKTMNARAKRCNPMSSPYCMCLPGKECPEEFTPIFPCGPMWIGRQCCLQFFFASCLASSLMTG